MPRAVPLVFFSSTREDLALYRTALRDMVLGFDILYRGMEFFGCRPQTPREVMLDELVECDLYIGIVAHRYGSIDPRSGHSYTELEYRTASQNGIPALMFLMDQDQPISESHREIDGRGKEKLREFRTLLNSVHHVEKFTSPEDLASKVADALHRWLAKTSAQWNRMLQLPLNNFEYKYIRSLHADDMNAVRNAVNKLRTSSNPIVEEHLYAALYRSDLKDEELFKNILLQLIHSNDERRVVQMLQAVAEDIPERKEVALFALGHRSLIEGKRVGREEVDFVLKYERDSSPSIRNEVVHVLGKFINRPGSADDLCLPALQRLLQDPDERVAAKARQVLDRAPQRAQRYGRQ